MIDANVTSRKTIDENYARIVLDRIRAISFLCCTGEEAFFATMFMAINVAENALEFFSIDLKEMPKNRQISNK